MRTKRRLIHFEPKHAALLTKAQFAQRLIGNFAFALLLIAASLLAGMAGYRYFEGMPWIDAFANAAMILSGMGPLGTLQTWGGKCFAGCYALYSGLAVVLAVGLIIAPIVHRVMHRFHVNSERDD